MLTSVHYEISNHYPEKVIEYLSNPEQNSGLYDMYPSIENFSKKAEEKIGSYTNRKTLVKALKRQLKGLELSEKQKKNLSNLEKNNGVTICTGHQLNLFLGPVYYVYKILHVIKLCDTLNKNKSDFNFVPVFWLASEDHDLEEVNHFYFKNQKVKWETKQTGAVGRMKCENVGELLKQFIKVNIKTTQQKWFLDAVDYAYNNTDKMAEAHKRLLHFLFNEKGLLIIDGDDVDLKKMASSYFKNDLYGKKLNKEVNETIRDWRKRNIQVNPRKINSFKLSENSRVRIESEKDFSFNDNFDSLSPNVLLRTIYQETILPNIAYVGGGSETNYWLQLKGYFKSEKVPFPILVPRKSLVVTNEKWENKWCKLDLSSSDLFLDKITLENDVVKKLSHLEIDFSFYESELSKIYDEIAEKSVKTDKTLTNLVLAMKTKQNKGFKSMQNRLLKAERRVYKEHLEWIDGLKNHAFPNGKLQERYGNFIEFAENIGPTFLDLVYDKIEPLSFDISFIKLPEKT